MVVDADGGPFVDGAGELDEGATRGERVGDRRARHREGAEGGVAAGGVDIGDVGVGRARPVGLTGGRGALGVGGAAAAGAVVGADGRGTRALLGAVGRALDTDAGGEVADARGRRASVVRRAVGRAISTSVARAVDVVGVRGAVGGVQLLATAGDEEAREQQSETVVHEAHMVPPQKLRAHPTMAPVGDTAAVGVETEDVGRDHR